MSAPGLPQAPASGRLRRILRGLHRDIGFLCAGLTVIYCISGVAVNHVADWNPNYRIERRAETMPDLPATPEADRAARVAALLKAPGAFKSSYAYAPGKTRFFFEGGIVDADLERGELQVEEAAERPFLYALNYLHLNHGKRFWTHIADLFAVALLFLAVSGLFLTPGPKGLAGRGGWLLAAGILLPFAALALLR